MFTFGYSKEQSSGEKKIIILQLKYQRKLLLPNGEGNQKDIR
jgi:hypothetical protein